MSKKKDKVTVELSFEEREGKNYLLATVRYKGKVAQRQLPEGDEVVKKIRGNIDIPAMSVGHVLEITGKTIENTVNKILGIKK